MEFVVTAASSAPLELEFFFLEEGENGEILNFVAIDGEEFACHSAACRPPTSGGTGGSNPGGEGGGASSTKYSPKGDYIGKAEHQADINRLIGKGVGGVRADGILSEPWLNENGEVVLTGAQIKGAQKALESMGTSEAEWKANITAMAQKAMDNDPEQALRDSKWYSHENETWGTPLAEKHGVTVDQVMGIAAATSTNKKWDGVESSNKEVVERILDILSKDEPITITPEQAAAYNQFSIDKPSGGGKYGPKAIEAGEFRPSQLSSGTLARVMGSGYKIGGQYFTDGLAKAFSVARGELEPNAAISSLKQRSFTNNLVHPDINYSSTNDFWMARALFGFGKLNITKEGGTGEMTLREWEVHTGKQPNTFFGTKGTGTGNLFAMATKVSKEALADLAGQDPRFAGMLAHEFQAVVWVQMQREYKERGWI